MKKTIDLGLSNSYGTVRAISKEDGYYLVLDDWSGTGRVEISRELFELIEKEFS